MKRALLYAFLAAAVPAAASGGASLATLKVLSGPQRDAVERHLIAPGRFLAEKLREDPRLRRAQEFLEDRLGGEKARVEKAAEGAGERLQDRIKDSAAGAVAAVPLKMLPHLYTVGLWGGLGFLLCFLMTAILGIASIKDALSLGVKVSVTLLFAHATLVAGGALALRKLAAG